jgi:non-canonical (house-cleaning) NTP pyrophosphatase
MEQQSSENLTPLEQAQLKALGFAANATLNDLIIELVERGSDLEKERAKLNWRKDIDQRQRLIQIIKESRDISNTLITIATLNELHSGVSA